jgi:hypothetical protein
VWCHLNPVCLNAIGSRQKFLQAQPPQHGQPPPALSHLQLQIRPSICRPIPRPAFNRPCDQSCHLRPHPQLYQHCGIAHLMHVICGKDPMCSGAMDNNRSIFELCYISTRYSSWTIISQACEFSCADNFIAARPHCVMRRVTKRPRG